jgi:hypothetical protein
MRFVIKAKNGELVHGGDCQWPFVFRTEAEAKHWLVPGDVVEEFSEPLPRVACRGQGRKPPD